MQSRYCYPGTEVLINHFGIRDESKLKELEAELTNIKLMKLAIEPIIGNFNLLHLQKIHWFLFKDIYPFAGKLRLENIAKDNFKFALVQYIEPMARELFERLKADNFLIGQSIENFSEKCAYYMAEINVLHPFREGNGRTIREFIRTLALNAGYILDWHNVSKEKLLEASIKSIVRTEELANVIKKCILSSHRSLEWER